MCFRQLELGGCLLYKDTGTYYWFITIDCRDTPHLKRLRMRHHGRAVPRWKIEIELFSRATLGKSPAQAQASKQNVRLNKAMSA
jgi:hypothetical protein